MSISLLNLLTIRPKGVVSKKDIGNFKILSSKLLCKVRAATTDPLAKPYAEIKIRTAIKDNQLIREIIYKNNI